MSSIKVYIAKWCNLTNLGILFYALYCLYGGILAFARPEYSRLFFLITKLVIYGCIPLGIAILLQQKQIKKSNLILLILPSFYLLVNVFYSFDGYNGNWLTAYIVICAFLLFSDKTKYKIFELSFNLFLLQCVIALFIWIGYFLHLPLGFSEVFYYGSNLSARYIKWGIFAIYQISDYGRLCGIFNEPGGLGTLCALFFSATFTTSTKWQKIILLLTGVCSYSFAFYMLIFLFSMCYLVSRNYKHIFWLILVPFVFIQIPNIDYGNDHINKFSQRFALSAEKGFEGNNRSSEIYDYEFSQLVNSSRVLIGYGVGAKIATSDLDGNSSYKRYIVEMGLLGFVLFLGLWIALSLSTAPKNTNCYLFLFIFLVSIYQRPGALTAPYGYILVFGGFTYLQMYERKKELYYD